MMRSRFLVPIVVSFVLGVGHASAQQMRAFAAAPAPGEAALLQQENLYERATAALDRGAYGEAIELYREVMEARGERSDASAYWLAFALYKSGEGASALRTLGELRAGYPASPWIDDADYLEVEIRGGSGPARRPQTEASELRMYALNSLMNVDPERALPLLEGILRGDDNVEIKSRALFVLLQDPSERALELAAEVARDGSNRELQLQALRHLGMAGSDTVGGLMDEIYRSSADVEIRKAILQGFMMGGDTDRLARIAREESDAELRVAAIRQLAMTGAADELWALYQSETGVEAREAILQSMFMSGNSSRLLEVARTESDVRLRRAAIQGLAMIGGNDDDESPEDPAIGSALVQMYGSETDTEVREAVLHALWVREDAGALIELFEREDDPELKRRIVQSLSMMESEEAVEFLIRLIER